MLTAHTRLLLVLRQVTWLDWPLEYGTFKKSGIHMKLDFVCPVFRCITMIDHAKTQELFLFHFSKSPQLFSSALFRSNSVNRSSWLYFWSEGEKEREVLRQFITAKFYPALFFAISQKWWCNKIWWVTIYVQERDSTGGHAPPSQDKLCYNL